MRDVSKNACGCRSHACTRAPTLWDTRVRALCISPGGTATYYIPTALLVRGAIPGMQSVSHREGWLYTVHKRCVHVTQTLCMYISHTQSVCPTGRGWCLQVTQCTQCVSHREGSRSAGGDQETAGGDQETSTWLARPATAAAAKVPPVRMRTGCVCGVSSRDGYAYTDSLPVRILAVCVWPTHRRTCCALILLLC